MESNNEQNENKNDPNIFRHFAKFLNIHNNEDKKPPTDTETETNISKEELVLQTYQTTNQENIWRRIPRKIRPVLKLCFASLTIVFMEFDKDKRKQQKNEGIKYKRMVNIPLNAAYMLWLEILEIERKDDRQEDTQKSLSDSKAAVFKESLELSSRTSRNKSLILKTLNGNDFSHFNSQMTAQEMEESQTLPDEYECAWEYFISKEERNDFIKTIKNNRDYNGDVALYIRDKLVSIGLLQIVEISLPLPNNLQILLANSNANNGTTQHSAILDDSQSIATNMNAYEDILYDNDWGCECEEDNLTTTSSTTTSTDHDKLRSYQKPEPKKERTTCNIQHFQICSDGLYDYGYYFLSKRNKKDGGIWMDQMSEMSEMVLHHTMSKACIHLRKRVNPGDYNAYNRNTQMSSFHESMNFNNSINLMDSSDDKGEEYYWISLLFTSPERLVNEVLQESSMLYALQYLPTLLFNFDYKQKAIDFLSSRSFVYGRLVLMGVEECVSWLKKDCQQLLLLCSKSNSDNFDVNGAVDVVYSSMRQCLLSEYPILNSGEGVVGEAYNGEIGKTLHTLAVGLERLGGQRKKALQFYIDALRYKKGLFL